MVVKRICPNPIPWNRTFQRLTIFAKSHPCTPPLPPTPLVLAGWAYTNDAEKMRRWEETVAWATANGCREIISEMSDVDFYAVDSPSTYAIGPLGGPTYRPWNFEASDHPLLENLSQYLNVLAARWSEIVGDELGHATRPIAFTGKKARRLLVHADVNFRPAWGGWYHLSQLESERRMFTRFRAAINEAIAPHEIDHVNFTTDHEGKLKA